MKYICIRGAVGLALILSAGHSLQASPIHTYAGADVQLGGSGSKSAVFVVDWNDGASDDSISFGLLTDVATIGEALLELDASSTRLDINFTRYSFGDTSDVFAYDAERIVELAPHTDTPYSVGPPEVNGKYTHDFSSGYEGADDHLQTPFWDAVNGVFNYFSTWTGVQGGSAWSYNNGIGDALDDGGAYGFSYGTGDLGPDAVPEPGLIGLLVFGIGCLACARRLRS